jgi:hypothetical protein
MEKKEKKNKEQLSLGGDIGLAIFSMKNIAKGEEGAMEAAEWFRKVFFFKGSRAQGVKDIASFVNQRLAEGKEDEVRWYVTFLNRCLGYNIKRVMREAFKKGDPKCLAKLIELGLMDNSKLQY